MRANVCGLFMLMVNMSSAVWGQSAVPAPDFDEKVMSEIVRRASDSQAVLADFSGEFVVEFEVNLAALSANELAHRRNYQFNNGRASGTMQWNRSGRARSLRLHMDVPEEFMRQDFENRIFVDDGTIQVQHFLRTNQIAVTDSGPLETRSPEDWIFPGTGIRRSFSELAGDTGFRLRGRPAGDLVEISIDVLEDGAPRYTVYCTLDPTQEFAVTGWRCAEQGRDESTVIEYRRDDRNRLVPSFAEKTTTRHDGTFVMAQRLILADLLPNHPIQFEFRPGMVISDNRPGDSSQRGVFRITNSGAWEPLSIVELPRGGTSAKGAIAGATGACAIAIAVAYRYLRSRKLVG